jgi:hypothetical protein
VVERRENEVWRTENVGMEREDPSNWFCGKKFRIKMN